MKDCKNADCGKCEGCLDEFDDPVGCLPVESIKLGGYIVCFIVLFIVGLIYLIFKK